MTKNKFDIIVADPPYAFDDKLAMSDVARGAEANYPTLDMEAIKNLPISQLANENSLLALWVPASLLSDGLQIVEKWGFVQKQIYPWIKIKKNLDRNSVDLDNCLTINLGRIFRGVAEYALIATRGKILQHVTNKSQRSICFAENLKHSAKPETLQDQLNLIFAETEEWKPKRMELFARRERSDYLCLGNQVGQKLDIRESLKKLIEE